MKPIMDFEGYYITPEGKVFCDLGRGNRNRNKRCEKYEIKPRVARNGYLRVYMRSSLDGKRYDRYIHRLVAIHFLEKVEGKNVVNHKDGNRSNNEDSNLEWVTTKENMQHDIEYGNLDRDLKTGKMIRKNK